jgi:hypothetical protein
MSHVAAPTLMHTFLLHTYRRLALASLVAAGALFGAPLALACGTGGYSYAGLASPSHAYGIGATVTPLAGFNVLSGHVAGWVGVGGPRLGPNGQDEWLQVGFSGFPELTGNNLYYELTLPGKLPTYHQLATNLPLGKPARIAVLEMHKRPHTWRVWLNGNAVSAPIYMPGSHGRWAPIATAESWDGGTSGTCNGFLYRFNRVSIAHTPGGGWHQLAGGYPISSSTTRLARNSVKGGSFLAAEGDLALRTLASLTP